MIYRDEMEACPRCGVDLIEAGVTRACTECNGVWIAVADVRDMAAQMQIPPTPVDLPLDAHAHAQIACPTCRDRMRPLQLYGVEIDICDKHGVWFDANELALVLLRAARLPA